jgi:alpha-1,2-mannosyltransferase
MTRKIGIVASLGLITILIVYLVETRNEFFDSRVYYGALQYWFRDGGMVYDWLRPGTPYGFTYPPFAGLVMAPMAFLPFAMVLVVATVATLITTGILTWWFVGPMIKRNGWTAWYAFAIAFCLAVTFDPVRETITFGQVNTLLLTLVAADLLFGLSQGRRWAGVGIGLAAAVKLTPAIFVLYLLLTRRWRAAATAVGTAVAATLAAAAIFPDQSREFWTSALWDTSRVGVFSYFSNQSERGFLARLPIDQYAGKIWIVAVLATLAFWAWRVTKTPDDLMGGLALTGILGCLISPVTWIHHCVWLLPAIVRCLENGRKALGAGAYLLMSSRLGWLWEKGPRPPLEILGGNLYVWCSLALLIWTPTTSADKTPEPEISSLSGPPAVLRT